MKWQIALGMLSIVALTGLVAIVAVGEEGRMFSFTEAFQARQIETGASLFEDNCRTCHGPQGKGSPLAPAINAADLFNGQRLKAVGFSGTVEDYVRGVVAAGRPVPSEGTNYPQRMPTWSQRFGGPLREDQIDSLVAFVMNWEDRALAEGGPTAPPEGPMMGTDITVNLPEGDPDAGKALAESSLGCSGCHLLSPVGPSWEATEGLPPIADRGAERIVQPDYAGEATTAEQYLVESVVQPNAYVVEGYQQGVMPANFGERITLQQMADLVSYMLTFR